MIWTLVAIIIIFLLTLHFTWRIWMSSFKLSYLQTISTLPWLGMSPYIPARQSVAYKWYNDMDVRLNRHYHIWFGFVPFIRTGKIEFLNELFKSKELITKTFLYKLAEAWLGDSVLTLSGETWKKRRNIVNPAFHFSILNRYLNVFSKHGGILVEKLSEIEKNEVAVDIQPLMSSCTLKVICETAMGINLDSSEGLFKDYLYALHEMKHIFEQRASKPWLWIDFIFRMTGSGKNYYNYLKTMERFTVNVINEKIEDRAVKKPLESISFLDILLDGYDRGEIDVRGVLNEVNTFMFAGHDTSASSLAWTLYSIALYPNVQQKLYDELQQCKSEDIKESLARTEYLEMVVKESLRLNPPVTGYARLIESDTVIDGNLVRKGTCIQITANSVHTDPKLWPDPLEFKPERFSKANSVNRQPYTFIPFSAGPRNCVGQKFAMLEIKTIIFKVLEKFEIFAIKQNIQPCTNIILCSENGLWLKFKKRI